MSDKKEPSLKTFPKCKDCDGSGVVYEDREDKIIIYPCKKCNVKQKKEKGEVK